MTNCNLQQFQQFRLDTFQLAVRTQTFFPAAHIVQ